MLSTMSMIIRRLRIRQASIVSYQHSAQLLTKVTTFIIIPYLET